MKNIFRVATICMAIALIGFGLPSKQATAAIISYDNPVIDFGQVELNTTSSDKVRVDILYSDYEYYISHTDIVGNNRRGILFDITTIDSDFSGPDSGFIEYLVSFTPTSLLQAGTVTTSLSLNTGFACPEDDPVCKTLTRNASVIYISGQAISAVPLPPSAILFGTALLGLSVLRRRKRKAA